MIRFIEKSLLWIFSILTIIVWSIALHLVMQAVIQGAE